MRRTGKRNRMSTYSRADAHSIQPACAAARDLPSSKFKVSTGSSGGQILIKFTVVSAIRPNDNCSHICGQLSDASFPTFSHACIAIFGSWCPRLLSPGRATTTGRGTDARQGCVRNVAGRPSAADQRIFGHGVDPYVRRPRQGTSGDASASAVQLQYAGHAGLRKRVSRKHRRGRPDRHADHDCRFCGRRSFDLRESLNASLADPEAAFRDREMHGSPWAEKILCPERAAALATRIVNYRGGTGIHERRCGLRLFRARPAPKLTVDIQARMLFS